jgi:GR25 family glycosyltransferase involved in LPS biosynthesis
MKSFIICDPLDPLSVGLTEDALESGRRFGLDIERFPGFFGDAIEPKIQEYGLTVSKLNQKELSIGHKGCFISHYELWNQCAKGKEAFLIFEHDVIIKKAISEELLNHFDDILNLDYCSSLRKNVLEYESCQQEEGNVSVSLLFEKRKIPKAISWKSAKTYHVVGTHGYIIKPQGAKKLIIAAQTFGMLPVDVHINCHYLNIYITKPSMVRICEFMIDENHRSKFSRTKGYEPGSRKIPGG